MTTAILQPDAPSELAHERVEGMPAADGLVSEGATLTAEAALRDSALAKLADATGTAGAGGYRVELQPFESIEPRRVDWLWRNRIPRGMLTVLYGSEGLGKSAVTLQIAALASLGSLPGDFEDEPINVAIVGSEDDPSRTIRPRLEAAGADLSRVHLFRLAKNGVETGLVMPRDAELLGSALAERDVRLVIIDPLADLLEGGKSSNDEGDVRSAFMPLVAGGQEHDFAILGNRHTNKGRSTDARERLMGSAAWRQLPRVTILLGPDPDDPEGRDGSSRVLAWDKGNLARRPRSLRVKLDERAVEVEGHPRKYVCAEFAEECDYQATDVLLAESGVSAEPGKLSRAAGLLERVLADGPMPVATIKNEAEQEGIGWRTVERAKQQLGIETGKLDGTWVWQPTNALTI